MHTDHLTNHQEKPAMLTKHRPEPVQDQLVDLDKCRAAAADILQVFNKNTFSDRELIATLGLTLHSIGGSMEDGLQTLERDQIWDGYTKRQSLGFALMLQGLDMIEHWAKLAIVPERKESE